MQILPINPPEVETQGGIQVTLTHKCTAIRVNPADRSAPVIVTETKGFMNENGEYQDWGPHVNSVMDVEGYKALVAAAGPNLKLADLKPAIDKRVDELAKAEAARNTKEAEAQAAKDAAGRQAADAQAAKTTVSPKAKPAGPDTVST